MGSQLTVFFIFAGFFTVWGFLVYVGQKIVDRAFSNLRNSSKTLPFVLRILGACAIITSPLAIAWIMSCK